MTDLEAAQEAYRVALVAYAEAKAEMDVTRELLNTREHAVRAAREAAETAANELLATARGDIPWMWI